MISAWVGAPQNWPGDKLFKSRKSEFWERLNSNFQVTTPQEQDVTERT